LVNDANIQFMHFLMCRSDFNLRYLSLAMS